jgi:hypothetical protein
MEPSTAAPAMSAPARSLEQRMQALAKGNHIRITRARTKREIREKPSKTASRNAAAQLLTEPPSHMRTMKILDLLVSVKSIGRVKANRILVRARVSPSKTLGGMTSRQRDELATVLAHELEAQRA